MYFPAGNKEGHLLSVPKGNVTPGGNWAAFIAACRAGNPAMANGMAIDAHYSSLMGHLMNNSYRLGQKVPFNAKAGRFGDDKDAHDHFMKLHAIMHDGVGVPEDKAEYIVGPWLTFDPKTERHIGEHAAEANALLKDANNPASKCRPPSTCEWRCQLAWRIGSLLVRHRESSASSAAGFTPAVFARSTAVRRPLGVKPAARYATKTVVIRLLGERSAHLWTFPRISLRLWRDRLSL